MLDKKVILVGYSGHGIVVAEAAMMAGINLLFYTEKSEMKFNPFEINYIGFESDLNFEFWNSNMDFIIGIGDNFLRQKIGELITSKENKILNVINPSASVSKYCNMGYGNFIGRNASINPLAQIGNLCIVNTGCIIEHECKIDDYVHIAPGAVLAGNVHVGQNTFIGANSVIKQGVKIGKNVIIGAGSVIIQDIPDFKKMVGNPSREI